MTTQRWDPLLAIDSSQSALSAEGGSGDKEKFNSMFSERLLAPHVNQISRLHFELHRRKVRARILLYRFSSLSVSRDIMILCFPFLPSKIDRFNLL